MAKGLNETVQLARKMEMDGARLYADAARKAASAPAKRLFESFAADEERHLGIVESIAKGMGVDVARMPMPRANIRTVFSSAAGSAGGGGEVTADEQEAIRTALSMEKQSYSLYHGAAAKVKDAAQRSLLERLASEENEHYEMLQNTREYIEDNQEWFLFKEWALLTGDMSSLGM